MPSRDVNIRIDADFGPLARRLEQLRALIEASNAGIEVSTERLTELAAAAGIEARPAVNFPIQAAAAEVAQGSLDLVRSDHEGFTIAADVGFQPDAVVLVERQDDGRFSARIERDQESRLTDAGRALLRDLGARFTELEVVRSFDDEAPLPSGRIEFRREASPFRRGGTETGRWSSRRRARLPEAPATRLQCLCCWSAKRPLDVAACPCRAQGDVLALCVHALAVQLTLLCKTCQQCKAHCACVSKPDPTGRKIVL